MLIVVYDGSTMSRTQVQLWCNRFKEGREDVNDDVRSCRPSASTIDENIEAVKKMILDNCRITIRKVRLIPSNPYECFRHETCASEDCSKVAKF